MKAPLTWDAVRDVVVDGYLKTGKALSVAEIARRLERSESSVRRVINECRGAVHGTTALQDVRETATLPRKVWVYAPATWYLAEMLLAERRRTAELRRRIADELGRVG